MTFNVLSLFAGIGGFDLGLERSGGFNTVALCESSPDRQADLARLFPGVNIYGDVSTLSAERLAADGISRIDVIAGGFPCQDVSVAGSGKGLSGERSGLWFEYARLIEEIQPEWIIIENSPRLRHLGLETILGFLHAQRYDAFWDGLPACSVGAYHERDRLFIVANSNGIRRHAMAPSSKQSIGSIHNEVRLGASEVEGRSHIEPRIARCSDQTSNRNRYDGGQGRQGRSDPSHTGQRQSIGAFQAANGDGARLAFWQGFRRYLGEELATIERNNLRDGTQGSGQSGMVGTVHEVPATLDRSGKISKSERAIWKSRIQALGNAVVPDLCEAIGRAIVRNSQNYC